MATVTISGANGMSREFELDGYTVSIGRTDDNDLSLSDDPTISRHHARLLRTEGRWTVEDLGSSNGTQIERAGRVTHVTGQATLQDGDVIIVGTTRLAMDLALGTETELIRRPRAAPVLPRTLPTPPSTDAAAPVIVQPSASPPTPPRPRPSSSAPLDDLLAPPAGRARPPRPGGAAAGAKGPKPPTPARSSYDEVETDAASQELFLLRLRYREGRLLEIGANTPFMLDDPASVYIVFTGGVDVFAVALSDGQPAGQRRHLLRVDAGSALFGTATGDGAPTGLLAVGTNQTRVLKLGRDRLQQVAVGSDRAVDAATLLDGWVASVSERVATELAPKDNLQIEPESTVDLKGQDVRARRGVVWCRTVSGEPSFLGHPGMVLPAGDGYLPLTRQTWLHGEGDATVEAVDSSALLQLEPDWASLDRFHRFVGVLIDEEVQRAARSDAELRERKGEADQLAMASGLAELASILDEAPRKLLAERTAQSDPLLAACQLVFDALGMTLRTPAHGTNGLSNDEAVTAVARASRTRTRNVTLTGQWWKADNGPLLGFLEGNDAPVALLERSPGHYVLVNPANGSRAPVDAAVADTVSRTATAFYRPLSDRAISTRELLRFALQGCRRDLGLILILGFASGALAVLVPIITSILFDTVIPGSDKTKLVQVTAALVIATIATALYDLARGIAVIRVQSRMSSSAQAGVWDRLLLLPAPFFRRFAVADLSNRSLGIDLVRQLLSGAAVSAILSVIFAVCSLAILFYYSVPLALVALGIVAIMLVVTGYLSALQIRQQRPLYEVQGKVAGLVLEFITGIAKLRVAGVENRAFTRWAQQFAQQRRYAFRFRLTACLQSVFDAAASPLILLILFAVVAGSIKPTLSSGSFLGFYTAFAQFLAAMATMTATFALVLAALPVYERMTPILDAKPEVDQGKADAGELSGDIEVSHLSFRYLADGPLVLNDLSLHVRAGEMAAIVGPSGSGKSSLFRILLGFEMAEAGSVLYDGKELSGLDIRSVRRQAGVVLQNGRLMSGSILTNIIGASGGSQTDAWEAARMAALDGDIAKLPMGINTTISEGGGNFSGGQRQRLMIARAVVSKPRILLFDEATSALDSKTQELVSKNLEQLQATRIVIAHRLSTILNADRIFVVVAGKVVQTGTYQELLNQPGPFAGLVRRQLA
jgi:ATP-binding cassette subfamily C protein